MKGIPEHVKTILSRLEAAGHEAYCVGGAVRDRLLGRAPGDWDVTTSALPEEVSALFAPHALPTGLRHGTVTVKPEGVPGVEVTTYRRDGAYSDCRRPDSVEFTASLTEDLARRDFTVNAMALDLRGALADPFGGGEDLKRGLLRAVGEPEKRFGEDALRILRGLRFAARLGFSIEAGTDRALRACAPLLERIAPERVREELTGILCGPYAETVLRSYPDVLGVVLPEIAPSVGFDQRSVYHCYDVWEHTARAVGAAPSAPVLRWTMLLHDLGKPDTFFLDGEGRCGIHAYRPGICRLFPLGRFYENGDFRYFLQTGECREAGRTKVKVSKWIDTPDQGRNHAFICQWHSLLNALEEKVSGAEDLEEAKRLNLLMLQTFYIEEYDTGRDFYGQFEERLMSWRAASGLSC